MATIRSTLRIQQVPLVDSVKNLLNLSNFAESFVSDDAEQKCW